MSQKPFDYHYSRLLAQVYVTVCFAGQPARRQGVHSW